MAADGASVSMIKPPSPAVYLMVTLTMASLAAGEGMVIF
jgi:hypothetical protein